MGFADYTRLMYAAFSSLTFLLCGCGGDLELDAMDKIGYEKRNALVSQVEEASETQNKAKEQFASALEQFSALIQFGEGNLKSIYKDLKKDVEECEEEAQEVHSKINDVEKEAEALFAEWEAELSAFTNPDLRAGSANQLTATRNNYTALMDSMKSTANMIEPILITFRSRVLFLEQNLNAKAVADSRNEMVQVVTEISVLIKEMEDSIMEADQFNRVMRVEK